MKMLHFKTCFPGSVNGKKIKKDGFVVLPRHLAKDWNKIHQFGSLDTRVKQPNTI